MASFFLRKGRPPAAVFFTLLAVLLSISFFRFLDPSLPRAKTPPHADAIVVLTGGRGRIEEGLDLLSKGRAEHLILSGVDRDADLESIFPGGVDGSLKARITLEKRSASTYENALELKRLVRERGYRSIIFITSTYHLKRAALILGHVMPPDVTVAARTVTTPNFDERRWWAAKNLPILLSEFLKYQWYRLRFGAEALFN